MRRAFAAMTLAALCFSLTGCGGQSWLPEGRELENMVLMRTLGVDRSEEGVMVTAASAEQSGGEQPAVVYSHSAGTVSAACLAMQSRGSAYIFYGHVGQLLAGEELAAAGLEEALGYVERDIEMRLDTEFYVVRGGNASDAITALSQSGTSASERLESMAEDAGLMAASMPRTVRELLSDTARCGATFAPALTLMGEEGDYDLAADGYALLEDSALIGFAEGDAALGVNLLLGRVEADVVECPTEGGTAALRVVGAQTKISPVFEKGILTGLTVQCAVDASVAQGPENLDLEHSPEEQKALETALAQSERERIVAALTLFQTLDADCLDLCRKAGMSAPWRWAALQDQWGEAFSTLPIRVEVTASIRRGYDVK